eukprot:Plantae.Rhodophyta-Hildenbrandia_rubra.ctg2159.p1 GENE.Plantae.Rhodophyta-Hildenbrandia_rubra.ctg2159~~Plantae.Rhodophyta-Hildenbrandia_rubra.ctg2159.p1  ORF type:complete len:559 (-),score=72.99 Plantae.Rhodophyta-Hildenbrandia_rubra.ctg2159:1407-3083(-)
MHKNTSGRMKSQRDEECGQGEPGERVSNNNVDDFLHLLTHNPKMLVQGAGGEKEINNEQLGFFEPQSGNRSRRKPPKAGLSKHATNKGMNVGGDKVAHYYQGRRKGEGSGDFRLRWDDSDSSFDSEVDLTQDQRFQIRLQEAMDFCRSGSTFCDARGQTPKHANGMGKNSSSVKEELLSPDASRGVKRVGGPLQNVHKRMRTIKEEDVPAQDANGSESESNAEQRVIQGSQRRAMVVDFDVFIRSSGSRRRKAFEKAIARSVQFKDSDAAPIFVHSCFDLSDWEVTRNLFEVYCETEYDSTDEEIFLDNVDLCFEELVPSLNSDICEEIKKASRNMTIVALHRGTRKRLEQELKSLENISEFLQEGHKCRAVAPDQSAPYFDSWKEGMLIGGAPGGQTLFVIGAQKNQKLSSGLVCGRMLGARTLSVIDCDGISTQVKDEPSEISMNTNGSPDLSVNDFRFRTDIHLESLMETSIKPRNIAHILAFYAPEGLYFAAREIYKLKMNEQEKTYVQFCYFDNCEWVISSETSSLSKKGYAALKKNDFPGLSDPQDVELYME